MNTPKPSTSNDDVKKLHEQVAALEEVIVLLKKKADDKEWSLRKTNEGIKILYKELESKNKDLQKIDQLKSDFVSTVSHELRTPLAITNEGINLVLEGVLGPTTEKQKRILERGKENLDRLRNIIDDLLDISKIEAGKIELRKQFVDISALILELVDDYRVIVSPKNIDLTVVVPEGEHWVYIDEERIIQVLNNLLNNAIKFTPDGGKILLRLTIEENDIMVQVQDSGVGIAKEDLDKLFKKFQQLSRTSGAGAKGTGLGLSVVKALVELHHGQVWATSKLEQGTTFGFSLPGLAEQKDKFDNLFDRFIHNAQCLGLILIDFGIPGGQAKNSERKLHRNIMNRLLQALSEEVSHAEKKFFPYTEESIVLLLPDEEGSLVSQKIYQELRRSIYQLNFVYHDERIDVPIRMGYASSPEHGQTRQELLRAAVLDMERPRTIMVVDDNEQIVHYLDSILTNNGFVVKQAKSGEQCLQMISENIPDLLVLDIRMPDLNGYELYGRLKGVPATAHLPVLIFTEEEMESVRHNLNGFDVSFIVNKREKAERLLATVRELI